MEIKCFSPFFAVFMDLIEKSLTIPVKAVLSKKQTTK